MNQEATKERLAFGSVLSKHAQRFPDRVALSLDGRTELTYGEWERRSETVAQVLLERGARKSQRIALTFTGMDWIEYGIAYLAVLKAGCVAVHIGAHLDAADYQRRIAECQVEGVIHSADCMPVTVPGWEATVGQLEQLGDGIAGGRTVHLEPEDEAEIIYSSATTGAGKGVIATHANLMYWCSPENLAEEGSNECRLTVAPLSTGGSAVVINNLLTSPTTYTLILAPPDHKRVAQLVAEFSVGTLLVAPWISVQMVRDQVHRQYDLSSVHTIGSGASPTPPPIAEGMLAMMPGAKLHVSYSGSQMRPAAVLGTFNPERPFAVGHGVGKTEFKIIGNNDLPVPKGWVGEIYLRSDAPERRYVGNHPSNPVEVDGWTASGDLGYVGPDGELCFFDRKADAILRDGKLTSSVMVEAMLYGTPGISEATVVELTEAEYGSNTIVAAVVAESEAAMERARAVLATAFPKEHTARAVRRESMPRDPLGKVRKRELKDQLWPLVVGPPARSDTPEYAGVGAGNTSPSGRVQVNGTRESGRAQVQTVPRDVAITADLGNGYQRGAYRDGQLTGSERAELAALRRENQQLREDIETLRQAMAVLARAR